MRLYLKEVAITLFICYCIFISILLVQNGKSATGIELGVSPSCPQDFVSDEKTKSCYKVSEIFDFLIQGGLELRKNLKFWILSFNFPVTSIRVPFPFCLPCMSQRKRLSCFDNRRRREQLCRQPCQVFFEFWDRLRSQKGDMAWAGEFRESLEMDVPDAHEIYELGSGNAW